jgi:hypothetical protein
VKQLIPPFHLVNRPLEHPRRFAVAGDDLVAEMRERVVGRQLDHLRIDHQHAEIVWRIAVHEARNDCVDADRLARPRGARDQEMRHLGQIGDDRLPLEVAPQRDR